ncbi:hypothetical protein KCU85_g4461, partial [Aureobasidium melanogenum]
MMSSPSPLASVLDVEWVLEESCVVKWEDSNHELSTVGLEPHSVILWVGVRRTDRVWVAMLQRTIIFEYSCRPKPFHFFIFLNPRDLRVEKDPIADELRKTQPNNLQHGWLSVRVPLGQLQTPGRVLMKRQLPTDKTWSGTPLYRLMETQSLSKTSEIQLCVSNQRHVRKAMNRLKHELPKILPAVHIDLNEIYEGRGGAWDAWDTYSDELFSSHRADQPAANELPPPSDQAFANLGSQTEENTPTSNREGPSPQSAEDNQSIQGAHTIGEDGTPQSVHSPVLDEPSRDQSTQSYSSPCCQRTPTRTSTINRNNSNDTQDIQVPPYAVSEASTASLDQLNIKPTIFITKPQAQPAPTITLTLTDLERLIEKTIQAQIPAIAAQVQTHNLATK